MKKLDLSVGGWHDYELIDSGDNRKLERFGQYILIRPETQALWRPSQPEAWKRANGEFRFEDGKGAWTMDVAGKAAKRLPEAWELSWNDIHFVIRPTSFKHTGVFPEQAANWEWIMERVMAAHTPKVLNLFGYTGIASIAAARAGAQVTQVDASRQSNEWAKENARLSEIAIAAGESAKGAGAGADDNHAGNIRYLLDDALKFAEREVRRGASYDGIILDPPAFGRGAKGEVWKIEEGLPRLLAALEKLLNKRSGSFFLLNGYAAGYSPQSFAQAVTSAFHNEHGEYGELQIAETNSGRCVPSGIYTRFVR